MNSPFYFKNRKARRERVLPLTVNTRSNEKANK